MKRFSWIGFSLALVLMQAGYGFGAVLIQESFDDTSFSSRGWYDGASGAIDAAEHISGSASSLRCRFLPGGTKCNPADGAYTLRKKFTPSDSVYLSYWVKHSSNWVGSGVGYHPHMFMFLTNKNSDYSGLAYTYLTSYVEENRGYPVVALQDGQNIDETRIGTDLTAITENRSVAGCNGVQQGLGYSSVDCYLNGSVHWNGLVWKGSSAFFFNQSEKTNWHHVEAYLQLNSISGGIGVPDGKIKYWYDGQLVVDQSNVIIRTGKNATMQYNQFVIAPYIGNGSPADQTFWIDDLTVETSVPAASSQPNPPVNLRAQ